MPRTDYEAMPLLLEVLRSGDLVRLSVIRRRFAEDRSQPQRPQDFRRKIARLARDLVPLGYDIEVTGVAAQWHRPAAPATDRLLELDGRRRRTVDSVGDVIARLTDDDNRRDNDASILLKAHVPRDIIRFTYGEADQVQGRVAGWSDSRGERWLTVVRDDACHAYRISAIWDLEVVGPAKGDHRPVDPYRRLEPSGDRPAGRALFARPRIGRPSATDMFRTMQRLARLMTQSAEISDDGDRRLRLGLAEEILSVPADLIEDWAAMMFHAYVEEGDIVIPRDSASGAAIRATVDVVSGLQLLLTLNALDGLSTTWTDLLDDSTSRDDILDLRRLLETFLVYVHIERQTPTSTAKAVLAARRQRSTVTLHLTGRPGPLLARITGLTLRGTQWHVTAVANRETIDVSLTAITAVGR